MRNAGLDESQAGIKIAGRDINNLRYTDDTTFMAPWKKNNENSARLFSWAPKSLQMVTVAKKLKDACSLEEKLWPA